MFSRLFPLMYTVMFENGLLSTLDLTKEILFLLCCNPADSLLQREIHFVRIRAVCRLWRSQADELFAFQDDTRLCQVIFTGTRETISFISKKTKLVEGHLFMAAKKGLTTALKVFLEETDLNPAAQENTALFKACEKGQLETVKVNSRL
jgi:hypothetical protein